MDMQETNKWNSFMQAIDMFTEDFMAGGRTGEIGQERDSSAAVSYGKIRADLEKVGKQIGLWH